MFKKTSDKRVAAFFAEGLEECEGLVVCDLLYRAGIRTDKVSISDNLAVTSSHEVTIVCDRTIHDDDFSFDDYDLLFLPGGMPGSNNLRACEMLCNALRSFASAGKDVAAVCAAPYILAELGRTKGDRIVIGFAAETDKLIENAKAKLERKQADLIVANDVSRKDSTFGADTSRVTFVGAKGIEQLETLPLCEVAREVVSRLAVLLDGAGVECAARGEARQWESS